MHLMKNVNPTLINLNVTLKFNSLLLPIKKPTNMGFFVILKNTNYIVIFLTP